MKKRTSDSNPYKTIARYLRAVEPLLADRSENKELGEALDRLSRFLSKTSRRDVELMLMRGSLSQEMVQVDDSIVDLPLEKLESMISDGKLSRRQLELIANVRFGVPTGSMRSFPRVEFLVLKLMNLIENERTHRVIDAAAKRSVE